MKRLSVTLLALFAVLGFIVMGAGAQTINPTLVGQWGTGNYSHVAVNGNYAYCAAGMSGVDIFDVSDPSNPGKTGNYATATRADKVFYYQDHLYVIVLSETSQWGRKIAVLDVSTPGSPVQVGSYTPPLRTDLNPPGEAAVNDMDFYGNYAYLATNSEGKELQVVDISNPASPTLSSSVSSYDVSSVYITGNRLHMYCSEYDWGMVEVYYAYDISTPTDPQVLINSGWSGGTSTIHFAASGNYRYQLMYSVEGDGFTLMMVEVLENVLPRVVYELELGSHSYNDIVISGNHAYCVAPRTIDIIDISTPTAPVRVGSCNTSGNAVRVQGNYAYVAADNTGFKVLNVSTPASPVVTGTYDHSVNPREIIVSGNYAYVYDNNPDGNYELGEKDPSKSGILVMDISTPSAPVQVGKYAGEVEGFCKSGNYLYVAVEDRLDIVDVTDPASPTSAGAFDTDGDIADVVVTGDYAFVADKTNGLYVVNVSNPAAPVNAGKLIDVYTYKVAVDGNYLYCMHRDANQSRLKIFDISDPSSPVAAGGIITRWAGQAAVSDGYAYIVNPHEDSVDMEIYNVTNPASPVLAGTYDGDGIDSMALVGGYLYLTEAGKVKIMNISNPPTLTLVAEFETVNYATYACADNDYYYVSDIHGKNATSGGNFLIYQKDNSIFPPTLALDRTELYFTANGLNTAPASQTLGVFNSGSGSFTWTAASQGSFLNITPTSGTDAGDITVSIDMSGLSAGTYTGTITVTAVGAVNTAKTATVTLIVNDPRIAVNRNRLNFAGDTSGTVTAPQSLKITNSGSGTMNWSAATDQSWLSCSPSSGTGNSIIQVSADPSQLAPGSYSGNVIISNADSSGTPQVVDVALEVREAGATAAPFGEFATPGDGSDVFSSVPFTGWVLDDLEVAKVELFMEEGGSSVYIGTALLVEGARPDVESAYPGYPNNYKAGWGYMMLTNFLPNGDGTYVISAVATDIEGNKKELGRKTITVDNENALKPFGAIDTPEPGGTVSGSGYMNTGWVLTPRPNSILQDGSTIKVWIDGQYMGTANYSSRRPDIAELFPGYANSVAAGAYKELDLTAFEDGTHVIYWIVTDTGGNSDGIGSRYFNTWSGSSRSRQQKTQKARSYAGEHPEAIPADMSALAVKEGYDRDGQPVSLNPGENGIFRVAMRELGRLEIRLGQSQEGEHIAAYLSVAGELKALPAGTHLDVANGVFCWQAGVGFCGDYHFVFIRSDAAGNKTKREVEVKVNAKYPETKRHEVTDAVAFEQQIQ